MQQAQLSLVTETQKPIKRRVLVIGASSGVGAATARLFAAEGAAVAIAARRGELLEALAEEIGGMPFEVDVANGPATRAVVRSAAKGLGGLDVLVNSAGLCLPTPLEALDDEAWGRHIAVNLTGTFYAAREAALLMAAASGGVIINIGSELSSIGMPGYVAYCAAKAGILGLTRALAAEMAPTVRVNAVCPGPIDTPMLQAEFALSDNPEAEAKVAAQRVPLKRFAEAQEIAHAIHYLAGATFATGTCMALDGGITAV